MYDATKLPKGYFVRSTQRYYAGSIHLRIVGHDRSKRIGGQGFLGERLAIKDEQVHVGVPGRVILIPGYSIQLRPGRRAAWLAIAVAPNKATAAKATHRARKY